MTIELHPCTTYLRAGRVHRSARQFVEAVRRNDLAAAATVLARSPGLDVTCFAHGSLSVGRGNWCLATAKWNGAPDRGAAAGGAGKRILVAALRKVAA